MITITQGDVKVPGIYSGPITISIDNEFHCADLFVQFDPKSVDAKVKDWLAGHLEKKRWHQAIIRLLLDNDCIAGEASKWTLERAEMGMQDNHMHVFEGMAFGGNDVADTCHVEWGAKNLNDDYDDGDDVDIDPPYKPGDADFERWADSEKLQFECSPDELEYMERAFLAGKALAEMEAAQDAAGASL